MTEKTITLGIPSGGHPRIDFINSLLALMGSGLVHAVMFVPRLPVQQARSRIASQLTTTHLLFVDDDMVFTPADVEALINADKDVVSGLYVRRGAVPIPIVYDLSDGTHRLVSPPTELAQVSGSLAFTLIKKEVIDAVGTDFQFGDGIGEDIDYILRIKQAGFELWLEPKARIGHVNELPVYPQGATS